MGVKHFAGHVAAVLMLALGGCASAPSHVETADLSLRGLEVTAAAASPSDIVFLRVVDVGQGLCVVVITPRGKTMVYDTGDRGRGCVEAIGRLKPAGKPIDLLVLSHGDSDHTGGAPAVLEAYQVKTILWTGTDRNTATAIAVKAAIDAEVQSGATSHDLLLEPMEPGERFDLDGLAITFVAGWGEHDFALTGGEDLNAKSIVVRLDHGMNSVLLTGDTIGRRGGASTPSDECRHAEEFMVRNSDTVSIDVEVMTAPHHGGNNGSSSCFIEAASPRVVIFSAGHNGTYKHPRALTAERYLAAGLMAEQMFRTDRGDDEGDVEWDWLREAGVSDTRGDDHVDIYLPGDASAQVCYADSDEPAACD